MKLGVLGLLCVASGLACAQGSSDFVTRLYRAHSEEMAKLKTQTIGKSALPTPLPNASASPQRQVLSQFASDLFNANSSNALIAIKDHQVIFEGYKPGFGAQNVMLGTSMTKSLSSVAIGMALCSGKIKSLDDAVGQYVPGLTSATFKNTPIRHLLTMTSGSGHSWSLQGATPDNTGYAYGKLFVLDQLNKFTSAPKNAGSDFAYSDYDANLLGMVLAGATGQPFAAYVQDTVWPAMGGEADATVMTDHQGNAINAGFVWAIPRDWARLGLFVMDHMQDDKASTCLGQYIQQATRKQVRTDRGEAADRDTGYGFLIWTEGNEYPTGAVVFKGARGQRVAIDPKTRSVLVTMGTDAGWIRPTFWRIFSALRDLPWRHWRQSARASTRSPLTTST